MALWNDNTFLLMLLVAAFISVGTNGEYFSATDRLFKLLETEKKIIDNINEFISRRQEFFTLLRNSGGAVHPPHGVLPKLGFGPFKIIDTINATRVFIITVYSASWNMALRSDLKREHDIAEGDHQAYVENPINAFVLIKRLTVDIRFIIDKLDVFGKQKSIEFMEYPSDEDLVGASEGIARLQETYQLNATYLAQGKLSDEDNSSSMSSSDCFELGRVLSAHGHQYYSNQWFIETLNRLHAEKATPIAKQYMLQIIAVNNYELSDLRESIRWLDKIINEYPDQKQIVESKAELTQEIIERKLSGKVISFENELEKKNFNVPKTVDAMNHDALCRGDYEVPHNLTRRLKCRYDMKGSPYLILAPFKVEDVYFDPDIRVYYDILTDSEIDHIKRQSLTKPLLQGEYSCTNFNAFLLERAKIWSSQKENRSSTFTVDMSRVSQVSWLRDDEDAVAARVSRRSGYMAGLSIQTAEYLQISSYGIGGHYGPHYDMPLFRNDFGRVGNRIATVLFYMSDVLRGGATAFTDLGITVQPIKGSAVVWRNLLPSTDPDLRTRHAACPVLLGSKWVTTNPWSQYSIMTIVLMELMFKMISFVKEINLPNNVFT